MSLLPVTVILLISAAAVGFYLVMIGLRQHRRSPAIAFVHAGMVLSGIILLFTEIFTGPTDKMNNVAALFLFFALVGGGMVFALHEEGKPPSMAAVTAHAAMGLVAIALLMINLF